MEINFEGVRVIGFDADDTLWVNETYFRDAEEKFAELLDKYETKNRIDQELFKTEIRNLDLYGYGIKGFILSMIECALELSNNQVGQKTIVECLKLGKEMIAQPVELLEGVVDVLKILKDKYRLIVLTKGDLLDQERKIERSGLSEYFHHVEVLSDKKEKNYSDLLEHLQIAPSEFLMIGNSLKSDVLPLVEIGARAVHVPFHTTWQHEEVLEPQKNIGYMTISTLSDILAYV